MPKRTLALDFDGVLHDYSGGWSGVEPTGHPIPGALRFCETAEADGYELVVFTCRAHEPAGVEGVLRWLRRHGFPPMRVTAKKPHAVAYIDDRSIRFNGDFGEITEALLLEPWWKDQRQLTLAL